jgi:hypothetical protein
LPSPFQFFLLLFRRLDDAAAVTTDFRAAITEGTAGGTAQRPSLVQIKDARYHSRREQYTNNHYHRVHVFLLHEKNRATFPTSCHHVETENGRENGASLIIACRLCQGQ